MSEPQSFFVLLAPVGQLSGNGQLRETLKERRNRKGDDVHFWYISTELTQQFNIPGSNIEAVVAEDITAINWLKLRFGGESIVASFDIQQLREQAYGLPPGPIERDISN